MQWAVKGSMRDAMSSKRKYEGCNKQLSLLKDG